VSLEWDGFHLTLGRDGLQFVWVGRCIFEAGVTDCVSASLRRPKEAGEGHRLVFRFRFPGVAAGTESVVIRVDVPPAALEPAQRFVTMLWRDHSVPDQAEAEMEAEAEGEPEEGAEEGTAADAGPGTVAETTPDAPELARVPEGRDWIVNPVGPRSEELFRDVMARLVHSER
jgi:hypothetical protein